MDLREIYDYAISEDLSKLYENIGIFWNFGRKTKEVYYFKQNKRVDFYAKFYNQKLLINVSVDIKDDKTKQIEINGLIEAMEYFNLDRAYLITKEQKENITIEDKTIHIVPLYEWLVE